MLEQVLFFTILLGFLITVLLSPIFIPFLRRLKFGQSIRDEGPKSHQKKTGTPTMGGIMILFSIIVTTLVMTGKFSDPTIKTYLLLFVTVGFGILGFLDDFIKVVMKRNLGLTSLQKLIGQILISIVFFIFLKQLDFSTAIEIPIVNYSFDLGYFYALFIIFWLVGFSNAVNLTDGLDGLAIGALITNFATFAIICYVAGHLLFAAYLRIPFAGSAELSIIASTLVGASMGFLWYNAYPAQIFMGDVGSLGLGGALALLALMSKQELLLALSGGLFVIETLSVIIQVYSFKFLGRRMFKMAPIHHHFELLGWPEAKITTRFGIISVVLSLLALMTLKIR